MSKWDSINRIYSLYQFKFPTYMGSATGTRLFIHDVYEGDVIETFQNQISGTIFEVFDVDSLTPREQEDRLGMDLPEGGGW